ncbi:UxaA family hydrolase [Pararhizobium sp. IMCC21322]|uniref:UxaA family hydrolase n=1 Tax=Pararhizobium sp. IMCC21322 TaxID=3067903 RepID=UPI002742729F|nr:UxaA family hydrolase [Pararhizobium sp. IMCC21322]
MSKARPDHEEGTRLTLKVSSEDNVVTVLDSELDRCLIAGGLVIDKGIPFGHKIALCDIACGRDVIKYGVVIGRATCLIAQGEHVHVHNIV